MKKTITMLITGLFSMCAYPVSQSRESVCYKEDDCKAGDVIILDFKIVTKPGVVRKVARVCDFNKTIYTYETPQKELNIACVYIGEERDLRKRQKN